MHELLVLNSIVIDKKIYDRKKYDIGYISEMWYQNGHVSQRFERYLLLGIANQASL
jgi:hypothetical protein